MLPDIGTMSVLCPHFASTRRRKSAPGSTAASMKHPKSFWLLEEGGNIQNKLPREFPNGRTFAICSSSEQIHQRSVKGEAPEFSGWFPGDPWGRQAPSCMSTGPVHFSPGLIFAG